MYAYLDNVVHRLPVFVTLHNQSYQRSNPMHCIGLKPFGVVQDHLCQKKSKYETCIYLISQKTAPLRTRDFLPGAVKALWISLTHWGIFVPSSAGGAIVVCSWRITLIRVPMQGLPLNWSISSSRVSLESPSCIAASLATSVGSISVEFDCVWLLSFNAIYRALLVTLLQVTLTLASKRDCWDKLLPVSAMEDM